MQDIYLILLSFLIIFGRKLAMELNIHTHNSINNANQVTHIKRIILYFLLQVSLFSEIIMINCMHNIFVHIYVSKSRL